MNEKLITTIKKLVIIALASDDELMESLVLKGGNALMMAYNLGSRGSYDLDYSMEGELPGDVDAIRTRIEGILNRTFKEAGYVIFDFMFKEIPKTHTDESMFFWGGYAVEFKVIELKKYDNSWSERMQRQSAIPLNPKNSTKFIIEISKFEYVGDNKVAKDFDGYKVYVYAPEMIALEKVRAICQQLPEYREFIHSHSGTSRAKDFYDIYCIFEYCGLEEIPPSFKDTLQHVFEAKRVPIEYLKRIREQREFHREGFIGLLATITPVERVTVEANGFDFYFDFVLSMFENISY